MLVYINGKFFPKRKATVSIFDHGYLYGDGIFETMRSYDGVVFKCDEHLKRLQESAKSISLEIKKTPSFLKSAICKTLEKNKLKNAYIRLSISRGEGDIGLSPKLCKKPTIAIIAKKFKGYPSYLYQNGVSIVTTPIKKAKLFVPPQVKSQNFLGGILAKILSHGNFEAILLNEEGYITEGTVSNIFIVKKKKLLTPPSYCGILPGITRKVVLEIAHNCGIDVLEELLTLHDLYCADEVFLTNTSLEIMPVVKVDGREVKDGKVGETTKYLMKKFKEYVFSYVKENQ